MDAELSPRARVEFDACMAILRPDDESPFMSDLLGVIREHGHEFAERWIYGWRKTLAADTAQVPQDMPLKAALAEFDALIERICERWNCDDATQAEMRSTRRRMSPDNIRRELPIMRREAAR